jgi:G:T-mismatch repair DNA endonuclease (very short patch repair protein)
MYLLPPLCTKEPVSHLETYKIHKNLAKMDILPHFLKAMGYQVKLMWQCMIAYSRQIHDL